MTGGGLERAAGPLVSCHFSGDRRGPGRQPRSPGGAGSVRGAVGHRGGWSTEVQAECVRGDLAVCAGGRAPAQREGEPPEGSEQKKARSSGSLPGPPWLRAENGLECGERRSRSQAWKCHGRCRQGDWLGSEG